MFPEKPRSACYGEADDFERHVEHQKDQVRDRPVHQINVVLLIAVLRIHQPSFKAHQNEESIAC